MSRKFKDYEAICKLFSTLDDGSLKALYQLYTGEEAKEPAGMYVNWAFEVTVALAKSDGLTDEEIQENFDW